MNKKKVPSIKKKKLIIETDDDYSQLSYTLTKSLTKEEKKNNGIYFTPPTTVKRCFEILKPYMKNVKTALEPSCGSGEFLNELQKYPNVVVTGIELNKTIYESIENRYPSMELINYDFLSYNIERTYDLIIGNPPYFVMKKHEVDNKYAKYFDGRPNIFILFIIKSLMMLNEGGLLCFVLPRNFLNCLYYDKTRKYINDNLNIVNIVTCEDNYIETKQETIMMILEKTHSKNNENHVLERNGNTLFGSHTVIENIKELYKGSTTLNNAGFKVNVGNVVWNQCKDILTDDPSQTLLIYSSDIKNKNLEIQQYKNAAKKNYIKKKGSKCPLLVVNRGYGVGNYNFEYALIDGSLEYLIENHLICIKYKEEIERTELIKLYHEIIKSLENEKTKKFIKLYFGNNAINTTELCNLIPIYL